MVFTTLIIFMFYSTLPPQIIVDGYKDGQRQRVVVKQLPMISNGNGRPLLLDAKAADHFSDLMTDAAFDGFVVSVSYGYRTFGEQRKLRKEYRREGRAYMAAPAGFSNHQMGISIDVSNSVKVFNSSKMSVEEKSEYKFLKAFGGCTRRHKEITCKTELFFWLEKHALEYGFVNDISYEPWHWTFLPEQVKTNDEVELVARADQPSW